MSSNHRNIAVIGLGYVGLPVAIAFSKLGRVIGYDKNSNRINLLKQGIDTTGEVTSEDLTNANLILSDEEHNLADADFYIVTVPTPINKAKLPDLSCLQSASETIGHYLKPGDIVVYESTVYPGVTEEECAPILERFSGLTCGSDFTVGYSPERINPGDKEHRLETIIKVVSGQDEKTLNIIADTYGRVVTAGIHKAPSIKVAEAAKVIENTQRDLNIALMNELALIFNQMQINTNDVIQAASTKWNFLPFKPGLVGGHCIGVDPYYLTYKAQQLGYQPQVILSGRRINDDMGRYIAQQTIKQLIQADCPVKGARVAILGITFKENCPDIRNSKVFDIIEQLQSYGVTCLAHGARADKTEVKQHYDIDLIDWDHLTQLNAVILAVPHHEYSQITAEELKTKFSSHPLIIDIKSAINHQQFINAGYIVWRL